MKALLLQLRDDLAALEMRWAVAKLAYKYNFNPAQPRVPAGNPDGGRWTDGAGSGWVRVAANDRGEGGIANDGSREPVRDVPAHIPKGASVDSNIQEAEDVGRSLGSFNQDNFADSNLLSKYAWFYERVRNGGVWDYKAGGHPENEDFGNFNYGATGRAMGFSEDTLLRMAGWQQVRDGHSRSEWGVAPSLPQALLGIGGMAPFGDDPKDQAWIRRGMLYYDRRAGK